MEGGIVWLYPHEILWVFHYVSNIVKYANYHGQSKEFDLALEYLNYVFTGIFTLEAIIRLTAMRLEYFKSGMNVFDFVIVVFSIAGKSQLFIIFIYTDFV